MRVGITGSGSDFEERLADTLAPGTKLVPCSIDGLAEDASRFDAVIIGDSISIDSALLATQSVEETSPTTSVVIVAEPHPKIFRAALLAGARDVWAPDIDDDDIQSSLHRIVGVSERLKAAEDRNSTRASSWNRVIVVLSPKGGSGKTTIVTNLAVGIARYTSQSVAIVDLDLRLGDVASTLTLTTEHSIVDAAEAPEDITRFTAMLTEHPSGFHALCAPSNPAGADKIDPDTAARLIGLMSSLFDTTVVDTSAGLDESSQQLLHRAPRHFADVKERLAAVESQRHGPSARDLDIDLPVQRVLDIAAADVDAGVSPVEYKMAVGLAYVDQLQDIEELASAANTEQVRGGHDEEVGRQI